MTSTLSRRQFIASTTAALAAAEAGTSLLASDPSPSAGGRTRRIGAVAYAYQYSIGLFSYKDRPGDRMDAVKFVEATRDAGGDVAQLFFSMITSLSDAELKRLRDRAAELDVALEVHGGSALAPRFEAVLRPAAALGIKVVGCSFGMMLRPRKIATLAAWDEHVRHCQSRLAELALAAEPLGITIGVENHLDFTTEELRDLIVAADSPQVGVIFDVGNTIGTLDDPTEAADILGPHVVATHYKDFAVVENANGFQLTMVPLGAGSLRLDEITARLLKHVGPDVNFSIEMMNGQQLQVDWLEDRFWTPFRNKTPQQIAATLRHIRSQEIDRARFIPQTEVDKLSHEKHLQFEADRIKQCIAYLKEQVATNDSRESTR
jgi:sugar phosphate isomerase/epimerase